MRRPVRVLLGATGALTMLATALLVVHPADAAPSASFVVDCAFVKSAPDDPIVAFNQPGASHLHDFFGNTGISAASTTASLTGVASTCANNDRSAYWVPSLYRNGVKIQPSGMNVYYENRFAAGTTVEAFPPGFQMIFGDKTATKPSETDGHHINWGCSDNTQIGSLTPPAACGTGVIQLRLFWPYCWDGKTGGDATSHMSFAPGGRCPAAFPHRMPTIRTNIRYPVGQVTGEVSLSSGSVYSVHADFFNGWDQATLNGLVANCLNAGRGCGHFRGTSPGKAPAAAAAAPKVKSPRGKPPAAAAPAAAPPAAAPPAAAPPAAAAPAAAGQPEAAGAGAGEPAGDGNGLVRPGVDGTDPEGDDPEALPEAAPSRGRPWYRAATSSTGGPWTITAVALTLLFAATGGGLALRRRRRPAPVSASAEPPAAPQRPFSAWGN